MLRENSAPSARHLSFRRSRSTVLSQKAGTLEFVYDYSFSVNPADTANKERDTDKMILQIAPDGLSKFSSLTNLTVDSTIMNTTPEQLAQILLNGKLKKGESMNVFKNYPARADNKYGNRL